LHYSTKRLKTLLILGRSSNAALDSNELQSRQWAISEELATVSSIGNSR
jgi:hypothetical protein